MKSEWVSTWRGSKTLGLEYMGQAPRVTFKIPTFNVEIIKKDINCFDSAVKYDYERDQIDTREVFTVTEHQRNDLIEYLYWQNATYSTKTNKRKVSVSKIEKEDNGQEVLVTRLGEERVIKFESFDNISFDIADCYSVKNGHAKYSSVKFKKWKHKDRSD